MSQRNAIRQIQTTNRAITVTKQELQERWKHLELKPATLLHLQELLDTRGITAAVTVTDVLAREKKPKMAEMGREWSFEELRLLSLEGIRPHLVDWLRFMLEALLAWHLIALPSLSDEALNNAVEIALAGLFLVMGLIAIWLSYQFHRKRLGRPKQKNPRG